MKKMTLICIGCPLGCPLEAQMEGAEVLSVTGHTCPNGESYASRELTNPTRIVTTTVRVTGGTLPTVSVKTALDIPKDKMSACIRELKSVSLHAPVAIGDVIIENVCGTGVAVVATRNVPASSVHVARNIVK